MSDRGRYDSAMFWLAFGTAAAVIGVALMTIAVTRSAPGASLLESPWFDSGLTLLAVGGALLLWALGLYLARRRIQTETDATGIAPATRKDKDAEAIRGYYAERRRLFDLYDRQQRTRDQKK